MEKDHQYCLFFLDLYDADLQTGLYFITAAFFVSWIKKRLVRALKIMKDSTKNIFLIFSLSWFFTT